MQRWESIETIAAKLNMPVLLQMSTKGITAEDIINMKYNEASMYGITQEDYFKIKTYFKNKSPTTPKPPQQTPVQQAPQPMAMSPIFIQQQPRAPTQWDKDLCSCFDNCGICCLGTWCPCCLYGMVKANRFQGGGGTVCLHACLYSILTGCFCLNTCIASSQRSDIRREYDIRGDSCADCCVHLCCAPCALTQEYNEVQHHQSRVNPGVKMYAVAPQMTVMTTNPY
jgi:Cys-rich protein (TIGR01571 family)